ncbi:MAG: DUF3006 domain-containing protein [Clostridiales bacterium]|nr:DUF3006 domain-containing protein [Clostridiales bacterium]
MIRWTVDRIEDDIAVCETEYGMKNIPLSILPYGVGEGNIIDIDRFGNIKINTEEENRRREELFLLQEELFSE